MTMINVIFLCKQSSLLFHGSVKGDNLTDATHFKLGKIRLYVLNYWWRTVY